jgi:hypothetical protein
LVETTEIFASTTCDSPAPFRGEIVPMPPTSRSTSPRCRAKSFLPIADSAMGREIDSSRMDHALARSPGRHLVYTRERTFPDRSAEASAANASCHWD